MEPPWEVGKKVYINGTGHMTKMATMLIYGKNVQKSNRPIYQVRVYRTIGPLVPWPIKAKLRVEPPWEVGKKVYINGTGHMTKMATMLIYGKNLQKSNRPRYQVSVYRTIGPLVPVCERNILKRKSFATLTQMVVPSF